MEMLYVCLGLYRGLLYPVGTLAWAFVIGSPMSVYEEPRVKSLWDCRLWEDVRPPDWLGTVGRLNMFFVLGIL